MRGEGSAELTGKVGFACEASYSTLGALIYLDEGRCEIAGSWNSLLWGDDPFGLPSQLLFLRGRKMDVNVSEMNTRSGKVKVTSVLASILRKDELSLVTNPGRSGNTKRRQAEVD